MYPVEDLKERMLASSRVKLIGMYKFSFSRYNALISNIMNGLVETFPQYAMKVKYLQVEI